MASFFRRGKPGTDSPGTRRYSIEELAAAFPDVARTDDRATSEPRTSDADVAEPPAPARPADEPAPTTHDLDLVTAAHPADGPPGNAQAQAVADAPGRALPGRAPVGEIDARAVETPGHASDASVLAAPVIAEPARPSPASASGIDIAALEALWPEPSPTAADPQSAGAAADERGLGDADGGLPAAAPGKAGWRERLRGNSFTRSMAGLFSRNPKLDEDLLEEVETALLTGDVGVAATTQLIDALRQRMNRREFADAAALLRALREDLVAMLLPVARPLRIDPARKPFVILTVGVNGVGKTTTIGKLARRFKGDGHALMLAAGDTFRAAAVAQLQAWGERNGVPVVAQGVNASGKGGDAASVSFDAMQAASARGIDVLIADTAGRLHTQAGLMAELGKIKRVLGKLDPLAPHEVLMVIDGTTGQNALSQLRQFHAAAGVTGLVVTKLDGTAKGGVLFALAREFGIPIRYVGIGERPEDLREFDPVAFVDALLPESLGA